MSLAQEWRDVPGFENYCVTRDGIVRSKARLIPHWKGGVRRWPEKTLKQITHRGYVVVKLGNGGAWGIHQLVAMAWIGPYPTGCVVNHINGIKTDNRVENLEYISNSGNVHHAYDNGLLSNKGSSNGNAAVNDEIVKKILEFPRSVIAKEVASQINCSLNIVRQVRRGKTWRHISRNGITP